MSTVEPKDATDLTLATEYLDIKSRVHEARERADRLRRLADHLDEQARQDEHVLAELEGLVGMTAQMQLEHLDRELGGKRLTEIAVHLLEREVQPGQAVHYRNWYRLVCAAGYQVRGKDPVASFLAAISRSDRVEPVGGRSGRYMLRAA